MKARSQERIQAAEAVCLKAIAESIQGRTEVVRRSGIPGL